MDKDQKEELRVELTRAVENLMHAMELGDPLAAAIYLHDTVGELSQKITEISYKGLGAGDVHSKHEVLVEEMRTRLTPDRFQAWYQIMGPRLRAREMFKSGQQDAAQDPRGAEGTQESAKDEWG